jgi:S-layer protein
VNLIDGSTATGQLDINTTNVTADDKAGVGLTIKGGTAKDTITLAQKATVEGGAGDDTITASANGGTFTGGAGKDTFDISAAVTGGTTEATSVISNITDFEAGDVITFAAVNSFNATKITLDNTVQDLDDALALATTTANTAGDISWFEYGANTYLVQDNDGATGGLSTGDIVVKLTGQVDLSEATLATNDLSFA